MKKFVFISLAFITLAITACTPPIKKEYMLLPDRYLLDCEQTPPFTIEEYLSLETFSQREKLLFDTTISLRKDMLMCNQKNKNARQYQFDLIQNLEEKGIGVYKIE
ncbi:MAG: hypothetical protein M0R77_00465 [Gammaproteobacteria bacterium]|nr:hypothetical protein [Acholeplasmataceae bacterium]MCK9529027.1 hypothetical protein [Gammaproteobacteria bacterium]